MKPVFKCDYCNFVGTQEEVEKHEPTCIDNYDKKSCYICEHREFKNLKQFGCACGKEIPEGKLFEFCPEYKRKERPNSSTSIFRDNLFGGF